MIENIIDSQFQPTKKEHTQHETEPDMHDQRLHNEYATQMQHTKTVKHVLGQRSMSVALVRKAQHSLSLQERTMLHSKSKVLKIL
jgi:hypothetical protein